MQDENNVETFPNFRTPSPFRSAFLSRGLVALGENNVETSPNFRTPSPFRSACLSKVYLH